MQNWKSMDHSVLILRWLSNITPSSVKIIYYLNIYTRWMVNNKVRFSRYYHLYRNTNIQFWISMNNLQRILHCYIYLHCNMQQWYNYNRISSMFCISQDLRSSIFLIWYTSTNKLKPPIFLLLTKQHSWTYNRMIHTTDGEYIS